MESKLTYIYYLHKGDNIPFYVGKSVNKSLHRSYQHKKTYGEDTILELLDIVETENWLFWESYWIEQFKQWGFILKNKNNGGGGSVNLSEQIKHIKSEKMKKKWKDGSFKRNWSKSIKDNKTGIIYSSIKELMNDIGMKTNYNMFYKIINKDNRFSYI
jgi:hypothetical protein